MKLRHLLPLLLLVCSPFANAQVHKGDIYLGQTLTRVYNLYTTAGADVERTVAGTASCVEDGGITEITAGVTDTGLTEFDGVVGLNLMTVVASTGNGFEVGKEYDCGVRGSTLNSVTASYQVMSFSVESRFPAKGKTVAARGTLQSGTGTGGRLQASASSADNEFRYQYIHLTGGTGAGQTRLIVTLTTSNEDFTVDRAWVTTPDSSTTYIIEMSDVAYVAADVNGVVQADVAKVATSTTSAGWLAAYFAVEQINSVDDLIDNGIADIQSRLPAALIGGRMNSDTEAVNNVVINGNGSSVPFGP